MKQTMTYSTILFPKDKVFNVSGNGITLTLPTGQNITSAMKMATIDKTTKTVYLSISHQWDYVASIWDDEANGFVETSMTGAELVEAHPELLVKDNDFMEIKKKIRATKVNNLFQ